MTPEPDKPDAPGTSPEPLLHVVLHEPLIPQNTGNIGRLTTANGLRLHLIEPLGFSLDEKRVRRAGLDYWQHADIAVHRDFPAFRRDCPTMRLLAFSKFAEQSFADVDIQPGDGLLFGKETTGLPASIVHSENVIPVRIPMRSWTVRSLNLANAVAIGCYEALRRFGFPDDRGAAPPAREDKR